ncbi:MAG: MBL fold metallo-hydrolase [Gammaproteobacteria bacterium]|nr:MBL fold metallo-hydrolase [Gammaproteobacteria bacterium]
MAFSRITIFTLIILVTQSVSADWVVPTADVINGVTIRSGASSQSEALGKLKPGERLPYVGSVPYWHQVELEGGEPGFVSKRWTLVLPESEEPAGGFELHAADLGTGLGIFVRGPDFTLIYDAGSNDDLRKGNKNRFVAFLNAIAPDVDTIDHVVLSHPHRDHVELLPEVIRQKTVRHVWDSGRVHDICGYRAFIHAIEESPETHYHSARANFGSVDFDFTKSKTCRGHDTETKVITLNHAGRIDSEPVSLGQGASMTFLYADSHHHSSPNENSLVMRLDLGGKRILFMGDAEAGGRADPGQPPSEHSIEGLLLECCAADLRADILIVGHHGSKTSSRAAFLDAVAAKTFIVSSGPYKYSSVSLPDAVIIDELTSRGDVYGTYINDATCGTNTKKIGTDNDNKAGGCDNILVSIDGPDIGVKYNDVTD